MIPMLPVFRRVGNRRRYGGAVRHRLLLWDIDGTLIRAGTLGAEVFDQAVSDVTGRLPARRPRFSGKTDPQIVGEYFDELRLPADADRVAATLRVLARHMAARADELPEAGSVCPGIPALLARLADDPRVINGVLTGNIALNAAVKLSAFGLDRWIDPEAGAYGSDHADRTALVPIAIGRVAETRRLRLDPDDVWVVGDTPRDLTCAQAAGAHCLLVATGRFAFSELAALGADATLEDLTDSDAVVKLLTAHL
jgi:phosphoglycolate phosphatase